MSHDESPPKSRGEPDSLLPPNWAKLAPLVDKILDAPIERRESIIDELSAGDPDRREALMRLVADCERDSPLLDRPAVEGFAALFDDIDEPPLPDVLGGRYRIVREAGRGGMARVFLARDIKHDRDVAVKVIRHDVAASLGSGRFLQEIAIAARLRHPNIVPMYDSGETDGILYFVMPYEEGLSLRARTRQDEPLTLAERISILRDIARALAYAHDRGVVHRDIKPDNVLLTGGAAVVSDFGIAKAVSAAQAESKGGTITEAGARIGTPTYMAPEQAVGDPTTDLRADIYSFGCLAYELFAGKPPFDKATTHEIVSAHVGTAPVPILDVISTVPGPLAALIMRCLQKLPADRPQGARELLEVLEADMYLHDKTGKTSAAPHGARLAIIALGLMLVAGAAYVITRGKAPSEAGHELTVAVLPLVSGGDSIERELAFGLSDEIATALVREPGVRVMSRRGVAASTNESVVDPAKTGQTLGAEFLVTNSLRTRGGRLTVLTALVQADNGAILWGERYERSENDLGAIREEIARSVGGSLRKRSGFSRERGPAPPTRIVAAEPYRLYVLAQRGLNTRGQSIQASADRFRQATELDTLYADAYSGLSLALALTPHFSSVSSTQVAAEAAAAARRALRLDPTLAQPHVALGIVHAHSYRWDSAGTEFRTGVRLRGASDVEPLVQYGRFLIFQGQPSEALRQFKIARTTEPASALVRSWIAYAYYLQGQMDSAIIENKRAFQSDSTNMTTLSLGALVLLKARDVDGAKDYARRLRPYNHITFYILGATGDSGLARTRLRELKQQRAAPWLLEASRAFYLLGLRDTTGAINAFERATDAHDIWPSAEAVQDPIFDPVRAHPRFQLLLGRVGLR